MASFIVLLQALPPSSLAAFLLPIKKAAEWPIVMLQCVMAADCLERLEVPAFLTFQKPERI